MAQQPVHHRNIRKLMRLGRRSIAVTIPIEIVFGLNLKKGQKVIVERQGKRIIIRDWK
jgi:antitoxin component of MazEF toxin-antitoxin module